MDSDEDLINILEQEIDDNIETIEEKEFIINFFRNPLHNLSNDEISEISLEDDEFSITTDEDFEINSESSAYESFTTITDNSEEEDSKNEEQEQENEQENEQEDEQERERGRRGRPRKRQENERKNEEDDNEEEEAEERRERRGEGRIRGGRGRGRGIRGGQESEEENEENEYEYDENNQEREIEIQQLLSPPYFDNFYHSRPLYKASVNLPQAMYLSQESCTPYSIFSLFFL